MSKAREERNELIVKLVETEKMSYRAISKYLEENGWGSLAPQNVGRKYKELTEQK